VHADAVRTSESVSRHTDHQCATNGNRDERSEGKGAAILFCAAFDDPNAPGCPIGVQAEDNAGSLFFVLLLFAGFVYVVGGVVYGRKTGRSQQREAGRLRQIVSPHPHYRRWAELQSLVTDGVHFTRARLSGGSHCRGGYASVPSPRGGSAASPSRRKSGSGPERPKEAAAAAAATERGAGKKDQKRRHRSRSNRRGEPSGNDAATLPDATSETTTRGEEEDREKQQLSEQREVERGLHESQAKIKVVGINQ
jgi:hypothetical protein